VRLRFIIDEDYDKSLVKDRRILKSVDRQYKTSLRFLKFTQKLYQSSWDEINDDFSEYVEKLTGYDWFYPRYDCVVSVVHRGISNWGHAPKIVRHWKENPYYMRRITAHELILSHYFEIYRRYYSNEGLTDGQVWALAEIVAWALTSLTTQVTRFWPWDTTHYTDHNYPQVVKLQKRLGIAFLKRKDFDEYIRAGIRLVKAYPNMSPVQ